MKCIKCNKEHDGSFGSGKYCSRACANSRLFSDDTKTKKSLANKNQIPWNVGKKYKIVEHEIGKCLYCGEEIEYRKAYPKKYHRECWLKISGGYRKGSGIGKSGWYKGIWCDSSYELAWVIFNLENGIPFVRNKKKYKYNWLGKDRFYIPDFIQNGVIIEIKGYATEQTIFKMNSVSNLKILYRNDLDKEFEYVYNKYGKNFINLYE